MSKFWPLKRARFLVNTNKNQKRRFQLDLEGKLYIKISLNDRLSLTFMLLVWWVVDSD